MLHFTELEEAVLEEICSAKCSYLPPLSQLTSTAKVLDRDNTGHGFYTSFRFDTGGAPVAWPQPIKGPYAQLIDCGEGALMGFLLWCSSYEPSTLEGYQLGDNRGDTVDLKRRDLADLRFTELGWGSPEERMSDSP